MTPKTTSPIPHMELLIDMKTDHEALSFIDAYSGYNQIKCILKTKK